MQSIKSYTDISQSKKLAEILPLESADMCYCIWNRPLAFLQSYERANFINGDNNAIPCWSLASLLNIIQKTTPYKMEHFGDKKVQLTCVLGDKPWELIISDFNNEVDTCVEMILKLHEEDLL